jgi:biopolymer transport protein ExbD
MAKVESLETQQGPRRGRGRRVNTQLAEINVVPLVDVMLVLLIIFMVATPMMQRGIDVNIPVASRAAPVVGERLFVTVPLGYRRSRIVYIDDDPIRVDILEERVRQSLLTKTGKEVFLRGDGGVQLQDLLEVMDRLKGAGVEKVGIVAKLPGER